jgi:hypothetical protein
MISRLAILTEVRSSSACEKSGRVHGNSLVGATSMQHSKASIAPTTNPELRGAIQELLLQLREYRETQWLPRR